MTIADNVICKHCINRMFNIDRNVELGKGNINACTMIVIPRIYSKDKQNYFMNKLNELYHKITGYNILDECYVTIDIKCPVKNKYGIDKDIYCNCNKHLLNELSSNHYKFIIVIDNAIKVLFNGNKPNKHSWFYNETNTFIIWVEDVCNYDDFDSKNSLFKAIAFTKNCRI